MIVISISGPSGSGKSTIIKRLCSKSYNIMNERYIDLNINKLDNILVLSKIHYISEWFNSVFASQAAGIDLLITDRSPIDTAAYVASSSDELLAVTLQGLSELKTMNIHHKSILITAKPDILYERIIDRLKSEPVREMYHERDYSFLLKSCSFYNLNMHLWSKVFDSSETSIDNLSREIEQFIRDI